MIRGAILAVIANAMVLWGLTTLLPTYIEISGGILAFIIPGLFLGILNAIFKPLLKLLSLPLIILTAGLFSVVINAFVLFVLEYAANLFKVSDIVFDVKGGFISYAITAFVLAIMNEVSHWLLKR